MSTSLRPIRKKRMKNEINVVPYIDVLLVLLVIFMVTAPLITPSVIELPSIGSEHTILEQPIEVRINAQNQIEVHIPVNERMVVKQVPESELVSYINAQVVDKKVPVVISADKKIAYEMVVKTLDALRSSGIERVGLLAQPHS